MFFDAWMMELREIHEAKGYSGGLLYAPRWVRDWQDGLSPIQAFEQAEAEDYEIRPNLDSN